MQNLFFFPDRVAYGTPAEAGLEYENVYFESRDGTRLHGWLIPAQVEDESKSKGAVVHMHGNAQNMSAHWMFASWLPSQGYHLFVFDYRGYGQSQGVPDEQGVFEDAVAALECVRTRTDIDPGPLHIFGQSLGGMLAIAAAAASPSGIASVVAEAPAYSYGEWADDLMPELQLPTDDTYTAGSYLQRWSGVPLLLIHGTADRVVPYSHSQRIQQELEKVTELLTIEGGQHNEAMTDSHAGYYQQRMLEFFNCLN